MESQTGVKVPPSSPRAESKNPIEAPLLGDKDKEEQPFGKNVSNDLVQEPD